MGAVDMVGPVSVLRGAGLGDVAVIVTRGAPEGGVAGRRPRRVPPDTSCSSSEEDELPSSLPDPDDLLAEREGSEESVDQVETRFPSAEATSSIDRDDKIGFASLDRLRAWRAGLR